MILYTHERDSGGIPRGGHCHFSRTHMDCAPAALVALRAVATECIAFAAGFGDGEAAEGLAITDELRALFQRAAASLAAEGMTAQSLELLTVVPPEILSTIMSQLDIRALARLAATCRLLWCDSPTPPPSLPMPGLVEMELRRRAAARGLSIGASLPEGALSWVSYLLQRDLLDALRRHAPLAVDEMHLGSPRSIFVDRECRLHLDCRRGEIKAGEVGAPLLGHAFGLASGDSTVPVPPTLVLSMQDKRIVSVATGCHCLALSAEGEVYSWGTGSYGALGHADESVKAGPRKIETLTHVESIAAGAFMSAAVDDRGRLFTWGRGAFLAGETYGLGYELDPATELQLIPKRVDALSEDRVVGVALGHCTTLAVTDAGAVFSFGQSRHGSLGHGLFTSEVLPRRIEALTETGRRFVAVAAGQDHSLALTEEGHVYGWGDGLANGHGQEQRTPQRVVALAGVRVLLVYARDSASCAVTERGELYTWGDGDLTSFNLGHMVDAPQPTPKRVEALSRVKVAGAAICETHTLAAGADGVVWGFGERTALGLGEADTPPGDFVVQPTPIPNLRVRTLPLP